MQFAYYNAQFLLLFLCRSVNCPQHTEEQRQEVRTQLLGEVIFQVLVVVLPVCSLVHFTHTDEGPPPAKKSRERFVSCGYIP